MKAVTLVLGLFLCLTMVACQSTPLHFQADPIGPNEKSLGPSEATSFGMLLFRFIPIKQNSRFENAMREAAAKAGGTRLTDVTISETYIPGYVIDGFIFKVQGTAVGNK